MSDMEMKATVLVVDDEAGIRDMLEYGLGGQGYAVETAENGSDAIEKAGRKKFDWVVCDMMMPGESGLQVLQALKAQDPAAKVIMVTGYPTAEMAITTIGNGAFDYISKPFTLEELCAILRRTTPAVTPPSKQDPAAMNRSNNPSIESMLGPVPKKLEKILVVDDDDTVTSLFMHALTHDGYKTTVAANGQEALVKMLNDRPDLLILDLMMPQLDGFYLLDAMRRVPELKDLPVVVITAKYLTLQEANYLRGRVHAIIQKGDRTLSRVQEVLAQIASSIGEGAQRGSSDSGSR